MRDGPLVFALNASAELGFAVAADLGIALSAHEEREFDDGEHKSRSLVNVRGRDVYVIHSLHADGTQSPNDKLLRLLFFIGSLRDAGAERVTAVVPYLAYARKDQRSKSRDPVTTRYVAALFEAAGAGCVVTLDVHNVAAFENAFRIPTQNLEAASLLAARCASLVGDDPVSVVSPDAGGIKRADRFRRHFAALLGRPVGAAFAEKHRSEGVVRGEALVGEVKGTVALIVDDLISAGHTVDRAARSCVAHGATRVLVAASHGLFSGEAAQVLGASPIERIVVTDTVTPLRADAAAMLAGRVERVSTAGLFAAAIARLNGGGSIEELLER
jgi:ribose-phosphate pyrophosphokinase